MSGWRRAGIGRFYLEHERYTPVLFSRSSRCKAASLCKMLFRELTALCVGRIRDFCAAKDKDATALQVRPPFSTPPPPFRRIYGP